MRVPALRFFLLGLLAAASPWARDFTVVAYNVENLFDVDGVAAYDDYQPARYTPAHALTKLRNIARVVASFEQGRGPDVLLLSELEIDATPGNGRPDYDALLRPFADIPLADLLGSRLTPAARDLPAEALLLKALAEAGVNGYHVVMGDREVAPGSDRRQEIACAVFTRFPVREVRRHPTLNARTILEVRVDVDGAPLTVFANHWKSGAGDPATEPIRVANARTLRNRLDEILRTDPDADVIIGGDFNSQYNQKQRYPQMRETGLNDILGSQGDELAIRRPGVPLYNLWFELRPEERGSDTYRGEWGTLIHLLITRGLYDRHGVQYVDNSFAVARIPGLNADDQGVPVRWSFEGPGGGGFSDHFPVSARFTTVGNGPAGQYVDLVRPSTGELPAAAAVKVARPKVDPAKLAVRPDEIPAGTSIRTAGFKGRIFHVEGRVAPGSRLAVEYRGETYDVWSFDEPLRTQLRARFREGAKVRFYAELGQYRERWQFVVRDASWIE